MIKIPIRTHFTHIFYIVFSFEFLAFSQDSNSANHCNPPCPIGETCTDKGDCIIVDSLKSVAVSLQYTFRKGFCIVDKNNRTKKDRKQFHALLSACPKALSEYNSGRIIEIPGYIFFVAALIFDLQSSAQRKPSWTPLIYSYGCMCLGAPFLLVANAKFKKAIQLYNNQTCLNAQLKSNIDVNVNCYGFAFTMKF
jgi:hypothetical protein